MQTNQFPSQTKYLIASVLFALVLTVGCAPEPEEEMEEGPAIEETEEVEEARETTAEETDMMVAVADLQDAQGNSVGVVTFTESPDGTQFLARLENVDGSGPHGIHVHENGECSAPDFTSAGGHFNPESTDHACPPTAPRHAGDFGNIEIGEDGSGTLEVTTDLVTVTPGPTSVVGKALILHGGEDDCTSQPSGDAGPRLACGEISLGGQQGISQDTTGEGEMEDMEENGEGGY